ncbi:MAG: TetR/AcrR family transcriptional regulator [Xanthobacteraceae bacterium]
MRARSKLLSGTPAVRPVRAKDKASGKAPVVARMAPAERKAMILARAIDFFAEYGLTAQTRALAAACGVAQRLLYRYFPSKAALLDEVYHEAIVSPFKAVWLIQLKDRARPIETRLVDFYRAYYSTVLTRKWLRLFLYASLAEAKMAPDYNDAIVHELLETIVAETAHALKVELPGDRVLLHEMGYALHGAVSHFAIRRHVYGASRQVLEERVVALHVRLFVTGFAAMAAAARAFEDDVVKLPRRAAR